MKSNKKNYYFIRNNTFAIFLHNTVLNIFFGGKGLFPEYTVLTTTLIW